MQFCCENTQIRKILAKLAVIARLREKFDKILSRAVNLARFGPQSSKSIEILKKWSWSPPELQIHGNHILIRDLCQKYENMSAAEGKTHIFAAQKIGKNSMEMRWARFLKHPSDESAFLQQTL